MSVQFFSAFHFSAIIVNQHLGNTFTGTDLSGLLLLLLFYIHGKHLRSCRDGQLT